MLHGLRNEFLYSAYRIESTFVTDGGEELTCTGTGFWTVNEGSNLVLITNRHVIDVSYKNPAYDGYHLTGLRVFGKVRDEMKLPASDQIWAVDSPTVRCSSNEHNDVALISDVETSFRPMLDAPPTVDFHLDLGLFATRDDFASKLVVCDFVAFPGFPEWHDRIQQRPILRAGTIASDPRYDYARPPKVLGECVAYEAFSSGGSSGSPVFAVQKGPRPGPGITFPGYREIKMIGINAGHLTGEDRTHSGISYMYKSSAILDLISEGSG